MKINIVVKYRKLWYVSVQLYSNAKLYENVQLYALQKINSKLSELWKQKQSSKDKVTPLKEILDKETLDVEKLEGKSITHLFHAILGNVEDHLYKEKQEALAAHLKYNQALLDLDTIDNEITRLEEERVKYRGCKERYDQLYTKKKEILLSEASNEGEQIFEITNAINVMKNQGEEIEEAIRAGENALSHLNSASTSLDSAEGWGTWDLFGGGLIADLAKHSHIDDAKIEVENTQAALLQFRTELADIKINCDISIRTEGFAKFADFFFDGLIADWCMQSRINESQGSVLGVINQVEEVLSNLQGMKDAMIEQLNQLTGRMNELITNAQVDKRHISLYNDTKYGY